MSRVAEQTIQALVARCCPPRDFDLLQERASPAAPFHARIGLAQLIDRNERNDTVGDDGQQGE